MNGEPVKDVTTHPMFKPIVDIRARIYDMQHQAELLKTKFGRAIAEEASVCPDCGTEFDIVCPECDAELSADAVICPQCGLTFDEENGDEPVLSSVAADAICPHCNEPFPSRFDD